MCRIFCGKKSGWRLRTSFRRVSYLFLDSMSTHILILINYLTGSGCGYSLTRSPSKNQIKVVAINTVFSGKIYLLSDTAYISFAGSCDCKCAGMSPPLFSDMSYCLSLCMVKPNHFTYILSHISPICDRILENLPFGHKQTLRKLNSKSLNFLQIKLFLSKFG